MGSLVAVKKEIQLRHESAKFSIITSSHGMYNFYVGGENQNRTDEMILISTQYIMVSHNNTVHAHFV